MGHMAAICSDGIAIAYVQGDMSAIWTTYVNHRLDEQGCIVGAYAPEYMNSICVTYGKAC